VNVPVVTRRRNPSNKTQHIPILTRSPMVTAVRSRGNSSLVTRWLRKEKVIPASSKEIHDFPYKISP